MTAQVEAIGQPITSKAPLIATFALIIGAFLFSLSPILIRLSEQDIGANATIFNRFWIATVILSILHVFKALANQRSKIRSESKESYTIRDIGLLLLFASLGVVNQIAWAWSLTQTSVVNANLLHNLYPFFVPLGGWLLLSQRFDHRFLKGLILALVGTLVIGMKDFQATPAHITGDALALLSAVFNFGMALVAEPLRVKFSTTTILLWGCLLRTVVSLPIALIGENRLFPTSVSGWLVVISLALFCQVIASGIWVHSMKRFSAAFVSLFFLLEPLIASILAWVILAERFSLLDSLAFFLVVTGLYLAKSSRGAEPAKVASNLINQSPQTQSPYVFSQEATGQTINV